MWSNVKWEVEELGKPLLCMDSTALPALVVQVWEERQMPTHDHKGPARTKTLAP